MSAVETSIVGLAVAVVISRCGPGTAIVRGLQDAGADVVVVHIGDSDDASHVVADLSSRSGADAAFAEAARRLGKLDALVYAASDAAALTPLAVADMDEASWRAACENPVRSTLFALQASLAHLVERRGRVVFVVPTVAISGAARLVPLSTVAESQRLMAKVAARQWGRRGITVNVVALAPELFAAELRGEDVRESLVAASQMGSGSQPALREVDGLDVGRDVIPPVSYFVSAAGSYITGQTLTVDGGAWMTP
jgi:NAD(P)-dependent dehydrogenase (short-subunit alcohol dehydrogenase family)